MTPEELADALEMTYGVAVAVTDDGGLIIEGLLSVSLDDGSDRFDEEEVTMLRITLENLLQKEHLED